MRADVAALQAWLDSLVYGRMRAVDFASPALLPNGRRLRGIVILRRLWLARDRRFYWLDLDEKSAREVPLEFVLERVPPSFVQLRWRVAYARQRHWVAMRRSSRRARADRH